MTILFTVIALAVFVAVAIFFWQRSKHAALGRSLQQQSLREMASAPRREISGEVSEELSSSEILRVDPVAETTSEISSGELAQIENEGTRSRPAPRKKSIRPLDPNEHLDTMRRGLKGTRGGFVARLARLFGAGRTVDAALLEEMQEVFISADVGVRTSEKLLEKLREQAKTGQLQIDEGAMWQALQREARSVLGKNLGPIEPTHKPHFVLVVGVNGVGKTTTIGKLASRYWGDGYSVLVAAGDTFRAAAVEQLEVWAKRIGCEIHRGKEGADPGAVIFDAITRAKTEKIDLVIADTAGRLHTKVGLMDELRKVVRTAEKALGRAPDEILLVLDATTGQNALQQCAIFKEAVAPTGLVLTKLDGTAKGGVVLGIAHEHNIPVRYIGVGEKVEDLRVFDPDAFISALFDRSEDSIRPSAEAN